MELLTGVFSKEHTHTHTPVGGLNEVHETVCLEVHVLV